MNQTSFTFALSMSIQRYKFLILHLYKQKNINLLKTENTIYNNLLLREISHQGVERGGGWGRRRYFMSAIYVCICMSLSTMYRREPYCDLEVSTTETLPSSDNIRQSTLRSSLYVHAALVASTRVAYHRRTTTLSVSVARKTAIVFPINYIAPAVSVPVCQDLVQPGLGHGLNTMARVVQSLIKTHPG